MGARRTIIFLVFLALVLACVVLLWRGEGRKVGSTPATHGSTPATCGSNTATWQVYFSPNGGSTDAIVRTLAEAKQTVLVQAYSFTSVPIAKALLAAKKRGVKIQVILDKSQRTAKYSSATFLYNAGIPTYIDPAHRDRPQQNHDHRWADCDYRFL